jgi:tetratricopeptide (TPR) repeat protein
VVKGAAWGAALLVSALAILPFLPTLGGQFLNWDDGINFVTNRGFRGLGWVELRWMATTTLLGHWVPLTWLSLGVNYALGGLDPWGYHLGNLLLHAVNAAVVYVIAKRLLAAAWGAAVPEPALIGGAALAALLFGVHPLRVESVAWITERRDLLSGLFFLLAVWAYLRAVWDVPTPRPAWRALSLAAFAAALLSKASTLMLPAALLLLDVYPFGRRARGLRTLVREKVAYFALAALAGAIAVLALRSGWAMTSYEDVGLSGRLALMTYSFTFYPWRWLWPVGLSPMYELPVTVSSVEWRFLLPLAAFPAITVALYALRRRWPAGLAAWVYSALMVLPVSGAAHAGFQLAADRYSYLSGLGFAVMAGGVVVLAQQAAGSGRLRRGLAAALAATAVVVVVVLGAGAWRQSRVWHDSETLWRWAVSMDPECALCHNNLGSALVFGAPSNPIAVAEAETHFRRAIALRPERDEHYNNLGGALALQGRLDESEAAFREFLSRRPNVGSAAAALGSIYVRQDRAGEAIPLLRRALQLDPRLEGARRDLALALDRQAEISKRQGNAAEVERLRQEATELRAVRPAAKLSVEIPGRDRDAVRP